MEIPKITIPQVEQTPVVEQDTAVEQELVGFQHPHERVPSNWAIEPRDNGEIWARNRMTMRVFEGSMELFNVLLRA